MQSGTPQHLRRLGAALGLGLLLTGPGAQAAIILANSLNDWDAAVADGIDVNGNPVTAGSADDAAQQGHRDSAGSGQWFYKGTNGIGSGPFSGGSGEFNNWSTDRYRDGAPGAGTTNSRISRTTMAPTSTQSGNTYAVREWIADGLLGETLRVFGSFASGNDNPVSATNNGVQIAVLLNRSSTGVLLDEIMLPGNTRDFEFTFTAPVDLVNLRFAVGPGGATNGANTINDFFNDSTLFSAQIELANAATVPSPWTPGLLLAGLLALGLLRRR